ncbi:MAG: hypothetical protein ACREQI_17230 [Candidatus Binataceae bacterium]
MNRLEAGIRPLLGIFAAAIFASCAAVAPSVAPPTLPKATPIVFVPHPEAPPPDEWNLFPDPVTGRVDIYREGKYAGSITGDEPKNQDPPLPHPVGVPQPF